MARHILIIERSDIMRKILQSRILATLDDAVIHEVPDIAYASDLMADNPYHLVLYSWDVTDPDGLDTYVRLVGDCQGKRLPSLLLVNDQRTYLNQVSRRGITNFLKMPCSSKDLGDAINRICNPTSLRTSMRYSLPGAVALLEQASLTCRASVLNFSSGGALCEFECGRSFDCLSPVTLSLVLPTDSGRELQIDGLLSIMANLKVVERNANNTPRRVRVGFVFLEIPEPAKAVFEQARHNAERMLRESP